MQQTASTGFAALMERVRAGSDEAARELVETYGRHILRAVRRRLSRELRSKFDSIDFVQSVWASFFVQLPTLERVDDPESLASFLAGMAKFKVIDESRRRLDAARRDVSREQALDERDPHVTHALGRNGSTPSEIMMAREEWARLLAGSHERDRMILQLRIDGHTFTEIARALNCNERTVRRAVRGKFPNESSESDSP